MPSPSFIPETYSSVTPLLVVKNAGDAIDWYKNVFEAREKMRFEEPAGNIVHAELWIGNALVMIKEEDEEFNKGPQTLNGTTVILHHYVEDVDTVYNNCIAAGGRVIFSLDDRFYGHRDARIQDPFGHLWILATPIETSQPLSESQFDEMQIQPS
jgi:PhnB protein